MKYEKGSCKGRKAGIGRLYNLITTMTQDDELCGLLRGKVSNNRLVIKTRKEEVVVLE